MQLFYSLQQNGVVPEGVVYNALISACGKGKQPERACEVF